MYHFRKDARSDPIRTHEQHRCFSLLIYQHTETVLYRNVALTAVIYEIASRGIANIRFFKSLCTHKT